MVFSFGAVNSSTNAAAATHALKDGADEAVMIINAITKDYE